MLFQNIQKHKEALLRSDVSMFISELQQVTTAEELVVVRQQKLLLAPTDLAAQVAVAEHFQLAANRVLIGLELDQMRNYVAFTRLCATRFHRYGRLVKELMGPMAALSTAELLGIAEDSMLEVERGLSNGMGASLESNKNGSIANSVEVSEYLLHEYNGLRNEAWWGLFRAVNEVSSVQAQTNRRATRKERTDARASMAQLQYVALMWNNLTYLVDKVSFGEWVISSIVPSQKSEVVFDVSDVLAQRAKTLGLRRYISENIRKLEQGRRGLPVIETFSIEVASKAADFVAKRFGPSAKSSIQADLEKLTRSFASTFNFEDEALFRTAEHDDEIRQEYFAAMALYAAIGGLTVASSSYTQTEGRRIRQHGLPLSFFRDVAATYSLPAIAFEAALRSQTSTLPTRHYYELVKRPFVLFQEHVILLAGCMPQDWTGALRSRLIKGGTIGLRYGELWEGECEKLFKKFGWTVLGRGVKLKDGKRTITDVDLVVAKESLLLLVQCKAMGITSDTVYEQWLSRSKILKGAEQALVACDHFKKNPDRLRGLIEKAGLGITSYKTQPVVITSACIFTGWNPKGVPVTSLGNILSILRGATVTFEDAAGRSHGQVRHILGKLANADEFVSLLTHPIDWRVAAQSDTIQHRVAENSELRTLLPELRPPTASRAKVTTERIIYEG